jgi:hypothetical protein
MKQSLTAEVTEILSKVPIVKNLARKKFISQFVFGLIQSRNVQFCQVAQHLNDETKVACNEVRIQDFFREVKLDYTYVAMLLLSLLPKDKKLRLCIDRTEWDFGVHQVNILMVVVGYRNLTVPLYWEMLDNKSGNSSCQQRNDLLGFCIDLIGAKRIGLVIGDREFVGHRWLKYLKNRGIRFVMRLPKHHKIHRLDGRIQTVAALNLRENKPLTLCDCLVDGVVGHVWVMLLDNGDYLFLFGTVEAKFMGQLYRKRWSIEACFQNMKKRGFDLENTHLQDDEKLKKLVALVSIAYAFCASLGIYYHRKVEKIRKKNHGYKANSFARKGIDLIQEWFRAENRMPDKVLNRFLCFVRYIQMLIPAPPLLKIVG